MAVSVDVDVSGVPIKIKKITSNTKLGLFTAATWEKHMNPYVPMDRGALSGNVTLQPFRVIYTSPYAHRQYTGVNFNFSKIKHQLATAYWDKACLNAKKDVIAKEISSYIEKKL